MIKTKNNIPKFPDSYAGIEASKYDNQTWMERNQKRTTIKCVEYLFDEKLGETDKIDQKSSMVMLDLGCGTGFSSETLIDFGFRTISIDILYDMLTIARNKKKSSVPNLELILADINYLPIKSNCIDHIISVSAYNFIAHKAKNITDKQKILFNTAKYLHEILKPSGRTIIEFYPETDSELDLFSKSFTNNCFEGFLVKNNPNQKSGQTFLLLKKKTKKD